ncbi:sensor histidine kinase [Haloferula rosea]|uniref:histidine kinase n=1 Tax=Haloferula rosea TaxID=490093 RepID=A0A934RFD5_9BACT|nr:HAMP domain-containing sensor histidine kinase [Haloferula rosea]MBK1827370.1 HAMP domain-containing histidine kinase [Haloferula rosea]
MSRRARFPLLLKMALWLSFHLVVLAAAFVIFVNWQLRVGLGSLISGAAGDRLTTLGEGVAAELRSADRDDWKSIIDRHVEPYGLHADVLLEGGDWASGVDFKVPEVIHERLAQIGERAEPPGAAEPMPGERRERPREGPPERDVDFERSGPPRPGGRAGPDAAPGSDRPPGERRMGPRPRRGQPRAIPKVRPLFLTRVNGSMGYWAAIDLPLFTPGVSPPMHGLLVLHSDDPSANGLFFDLKPWIYGGLAVLGLSLLIWAPFIAGITRYSLRLARATDQIADGDFGVRIRGRRRDELGSIGRSIEHMAERIERLLTGQQRFLADVAHELCSPLARIRTGLGVLEHSIAEDQKPRLESIDEDVTELSDLLSELLAFTRAATAPESAVIEKVALIDLIAPAIDREAPGHQVDLRGVEGVSVMADKRLLGRAIANILRNAHRHGGSECRITITARGRGGKIELSIADSGPGVAEEALPHLFEPFYRPDQARSREAGGVGLGMSIVRSAVQASKGTVEAYSADPSGLVVLMTLKGV